MADTVTKRKRSEIMRAVKSQGSKIEKFLCSELKKRGYHFKTNVRRLPGKPDIVFIKKRIAIFIDSCFWHGCRQHCRVPQKNQRYWKNKIANNKARDKRITALYKKMGWKILRIWEHSLKNPNVQMKKIEKYLK